ncbi:hypothetical protein NVV99_13685 [Rhodococcus sp. PAE-6]|uniref:hypothetical protein n=1 Tax=Rhodococcus sp. PAE-6 TaxID=2972477 RepID=UPI0021B1D907|nr:hypothetical protein [Rhodococcus sp. PAE-6]MCT7291992.1 hypothetical protein [Rhodococcus sp. PAE-6]
MTDSPETLDLTEYAYTIGGLLDVAIEHKLRLEITTTDASKSRGVPVQYWRGDNALVTLVADGETWFVPTAHITRIVPLTEDAPITIHAL